jgi:peptidoglycan hydrolase FlgJ
MPGLLEHGVLLPQDRHEDVRRRLESMRLQERLEGSSGDRREAKLRESSQDFEAIFIHQMLKQMRATVPKDGLLHSRDEEFWQSHLDTELSVLLARRGGLGLGDMIFEQLREHQVKASQSSSPSSMNIPAMTLLEPDDPGTAINASPQDTPGEYSDQQAMAPGQGIETGRGPYVSAQDGLTGPVVMPGASEVMGVVRSLARSIEERGGVVPEHPGSAQGIDSGAFSDMTSSVGLPPMHWPLQSRVSSGFGWRPDPFTGERAWHAGVDLAAPVGTPVRAAWDGRVVFVGERGGYGRMVVLEHAEGWRTYYAHNNENRVKVGDQVRAGQTVATVGSSGRATGPHLHFEIRQGNMAWNPKQIRDRLLAGLPIGRQDSA